MPILVHVSCPTSGVGKYDRHHGVQAVIDNVYTMVLKKPSILFSVYGSFQNPHCSSQFCTTQVSISPRSRRSQPATQSTDSRRSQWRQYADVRSHGRSSQSSDDLQWPDLASPTAIPTPYQIFQQAKGAPYSKRRFYELVKVYHPDCHKHDEQSSRLGSLSEAVKLERYRLIVAANDILSDPEKRSAYDRYGSGWNNQPCISGKRREWSHSTGWTGFDHNSAARNATWEDWEKWYRGETKGKQEAPYFSNGGIFSLIMFVTILGAMGQITRVSDFSRPFFDQIEAMHDESSKDLRRIRKETQSFSNKDARVHNFLKVRDPVGFGIIDPKEEGYRKLLSEPEVCMSNDIRGRASDKAKGQTG